MHQCSHSIHLHPEPITGASSSQRAKCLWDERHTATPDTQAWLSKKLHPLLPQTFQLSGSGICFAQYDLQSNRRHSSEMVGLNDIEETEIDEHELDEHDDDAAPSIVRRAISKLQGASDWYAESVHPYIESVRQPIGYVLWCAVTFAVVAGLPTAKAVFSDPYTELSAILVEQELAEAERLAKRRPVRL